MNLFTRRDPGESSATAAPPLERLARHVETALAASRALSAADLFALAADAYGGTLEGRMRFPLEVVEACRAELDSLRSGTGESGEPAVGGQERVADLEREIASLEAERDEA